jgi:hypothetical protein
MLLNELQTSKERRIAKINKALKESYGFSLSSDVELPKLDSLYKKVKDDLYELKLDNATARDGEYIEKLLVKEGLEILRESAMLAGPGGRAMERVVGFLADFVRNACEVGDDYEEAIYDAMKQYRSSKYRFGDDHVEFELRKLTSDCDPLEECGGMMYEEAKPDFADIDDDGDKEEPMKKAAKDKMEEDGYPDCAECGNINDDNPGKDMCKTCDDWFVQGKEEVEEANPDRYAERDWVRVIAKDQAKASGDQELELSLVGDDDDDGDDYFSYNRKRGMKEGYVKTLRKLLEAETAQAESLIAAKSFSQELQDMIEKLGRLVNEDLPAVAEQMRDSHGADVATGFEDTVSGTLNGIMDSLRSSKQELDNSVSAIADGGMPEAPVDMDSFDAEGDMDLDVDAELDVDDLDADVELDMEPGDELGGMDAAAGPEDEELGRAKKESVEQLRKKIVEMQEKIARAKKRKA